MYRFLPGLFYDNSTICKHWFYYEIILNYQKWSIDVKFCRLCEIVLVLMWFGVDFYRHKYWWSCDALVLIFVDLMLNTDRFTNNDFCRFDDIQDDIEDSILNPTEGGPGVLSLADQQEILEVWPRPPPSSVVLSVWRPSAHRHCGATSPNMTGCPCLLIPSPPQLHFLLFL